MSILFVNSIIGFIGCIGYIYSGFPFVGYTFSFCLVDLATGVKLVPGAGAFSVPRLELRSGRCFSLAHKVHLRLHR